jgi:hypothetical protein
LSQNRIFSTGAGLFVTTRPRYTKAERKFWVTRFPSEKYDDDCLAPKLANIPKIMIRGVIAVDVKGPLIIFEKDKGMTNAKGVIAMLITSY